MSSIECSKGRNSDFSAYFGKIVMLKEATCFICAIIKKISDWNNYLICICLFIGDRLCGLVARVSGYRYRGPGFDPRRYQIF